MKAESYLLRTNDDANKIYRSMQRLLNSNVKDKGENLAVSIENETAMRNKKQNRLIHAIFGQISDLTASTGKGKRTPMLTIKAALKDKYLGYNAIKLKNKIVYELKSTASLTRKECAKFTDDIINWCKEYDIPLVLIDKDYEYLTGKRI